MIHIVVPLRGAVDAIGPVEAGVEPLRAVGGRALRGQHMTHLVIIGAGVFFGGEIAALPTPVRPCACQTVEHLLGGRLAAHLCALNGNGAPQKLGHALFLHALGLRRDACFAEIFLGDDIRRNLAP